MNEDAVTFVAAQPLYFAFIWELLLKATGLSGSLLSVGTVLLPLCGSHQAQCHSGSLSRQHRRLQMPQGFSLAHPDSGQPHANQEHVL